MLRIIQVSEALDLLRQVVNEKGHDYRYTAEFAECVNFIDPELNPESDLPQGAPACVAGHVYAKLGLGLGQVGNSSVGAAVFKLVSGHALVQFTPEAAFVLAVAQSIQDKGGTWGEAFSAVENLGTLLTWEYQVKYRPSVQADYEAEVANG